MINPPSVGSYIVAVASSAGGLRALTSILSPLPRNFPAAVAVVQHTDPHQPSILVSLLSRRVRLKVKVPEQGERPEPGVIYVAPPDWHLLSNLDGSFALDQTHLVHYVRPSADVLFISLAAAFRTRAIAVVLTGTGSDGESGVRAIKKEGGFVIAQDEGSSEYFGMPGSAISTGCVDLVLPLDNIAPVLIDLVMAGKYYGRTTE